MSDDIKRRLAEICDSNRDALLEVASLLIQHNEPPQPDAEAEATRRLMERITAKPYVSTSEAAKLLCCSPQHLRNRVQDAIDGRSDIPIPFLDLDGVLSFPVDELLAWARQPKAKPKKPEKINHSNSAQKVVAESVAEISSRRSTTRLQSAPSQTRKGAA